MEKKVTTRFARANLSRLIADVEKGATFVVTRHAIPVARLAPVSQRPSRKFGALRGKIDIGPEFFEPLPESELQA
jgi:antitoxin (DNA-binding transcriptional repressor) of toxin-antitoxin stability system